MSRMRDLGKGFGGWLLDSAREWIAVLGGLGGGGGIALLLWQGDVTSVLAVVGLVLGACAFVAAVFGLRNRNLGNWVGAIIALVLGIATLIVFRAAAGG